MVSADRHTVVLLGALRATWATFVDAMAGAVEAGVPDYSAIAAGDLRATVDRLAAMFAKDLAGEQPSGRDVQWLRSLGARRARAGLDIESVKTAVRCAVVAAFGHIGEHVSALQLDDSAQADLWQTVLSSVLRTQDAVQRALADGFSEGRTEQLTDEALRTVAFVDRVITADSSDAPGCAAQAKAFGIDEDTRCGLVLLLLDGDGHGDLRASARPVIGAVTGAIEGPIRWEPTPHVVVLLRPGQPDEWASQLEAVEKEVTRLGGIVMLSAAGGEALPQLPEVYLALRQDLEFARVLPSKPPHLKRSLLLLCRLLSAAPAMERFILFRSALRAVVADPRGADLLDLLDAVVAGGSRLAAAGSLGRHKETVRRGLKTVEALTGLDWDDRLDSAALTTVVICRWLDAPSADYEEAVWGPRPKHLDRRAR